MATDKQIAFGKLIKEKRKYLLRLGFKSSTISMWQCGKRVPSYENAILLNQVLHISINKIPHTKVIKCI